MDLIEESRAMINEKLEEFESANQENNRGAGPSTQTPTDGCFLAEQDRNLNKILNQQTHLKRIIDQDNNIQILKNSLSRVALEIEGLRRSCTKQNEEALKARQELAQAQSKELEKYQMNQIRSISEDYNRHQEILETRRKEIVALQKEIEREEKDRGAYLVDVERKLERQLQERQRAIRGGSLPFAQTSNAAGNNSLDDELHNPDHIELTSMDEYAPYGAAPHSRVSQSQRGARGGRGRGRRRGRG